MQRSKLYVLVLGCVFIVSVSMNLYSVFVKQSVKQSSLGALELDGLYNGDFVHEKELPPPQDGEIGYRFRVGLLVNEIYYHLLIEKIRHDDSKQIRDYILFEKSVNGFELAEELEIKHGRLVNLEFIKWVSPNSFILKEHDKYIQITVNEKGDEGGLEIESKLINY